MATIWNSADQVSGTWTLSGSDLIATRTGTDGGSYRSIRANESKASGKWYFELSTSATCMLGFGRSDASLTTFNGASDGGKSWGCLLAYSGPAAFYNGSNIAISGASTASNLSYGFEVDLDAGTVRLWEGATDRGLVFGPSIPSFSSAISGTVFPMISSSGTPAVTARFAAGTFNRTPTSGYEAWDAGGGGGSSAGAAVHYYRQLMG